MAALLLAWMVDDVGADVPSLVFPAAPRLELLGCCAVDTAVELAVDVFAAAASSSSSTAAWFVLTLTNPHPLINSRNSSYVVRWNVSYRYLSENAFLRIAKYFPSGRNVTMS